MCNVEHPNYYQHGKVLDNGDSQYEVIVVLEKLSKNLALGFCIGNAIKYISRCYDKESVSKDLKKAIWYLNRASEYSCCYRFKDNEYYKEFLSNWELPIELKTSIKSILFGNYGLAVIRIKSFLTYYEG